MESEDCIIHHRALCIITFFAASRFSWNTSIKNLASSSHAPAKPQGLYNIIPILILSIAMICDYSIIDTNEM